MFRIRWEGLEALRDSLDRLIDLEETVIEPGAYKWFQHIRAKLKGKPYPAKRPGQKYVRTGNLANRWAVEEGAGSWFVRNTAPYADEVVGDRQSEYFKGRWWTARDVVDQETPFLADVLIDNIEAQWRSA